MVKIKLSDKSGAIFVHETELDCSEPPDVIEYKHKTYVQVQVGLGDAWRDFVGYREATYVELYHD